MFHYMKVKERRLNVRIIGSCDCGKIYLGVLVDRIYTLIDELIYDEEKGFRLEWGCVANAKVRVSTNFN